MKKNFFSLILLASICLILSLTASANTLTVKEVRAGGIVVFENGFTARFTGLIVPGLEQNLGDQIHDFIKREIEGKIVRVFTYTTNNMASGIVRDENGNAFVQIEYGEIGREKGNVTNMNELLLKKGYARVDEKYLPGDLGHFWKLEKEARDSELGIWAK